MIKHLKILAMSIGAVLLLAVLVFEVTQDKQAPNATFTTLQGKKISMSSLKGKVVLVNFWATECRACVTEMPALASIYNEYKSKGFEVIAVAMPYDPPAQVFNYATQKKLPFPVMDDGLGDIVKQFDDVSVTPTTYIYNKQGKRIQYTIGALNFKQLRQLLDRELH
ncbi:MAG: TlpA family protein disulfide reductase [Bdellovibrio sp.]|nr:TlpA family protein disulfide reductase [Methylotenera sp.]